jgi:hypothetical protein
MKPLDFVVLFLNRRYEKLFSFMFYVMLFIYIVVRFAFVFSSNIGFEAGEEDNIWNILNVSSGRSMYISPTHKPYEIFLYAPIAQYIYVIIVKTLHLTDIYWISVILRSTSLIFNILTVRLIYIYFRDQLPLLNEKNRKWLVFLGLLSLIHLNWTVRVDAIALYFSLFTIVYVFRNFDDRRLIVSVLTGVLIGITIFTKQDGIQLLFIIPIAFTLLGRFKISALIFLFGLITMLILFYICFLLFGNAFYESVIGGLTNPSSVSNAFNVVNRYFQLYGILPIIITILFFWGVFVIQNEFIRFLSLILLGVFSFATITSMKFGAWVNYFSLFNLLGVLLLGHFINANKMDSYFKGGTILFFCYFFSGLVFHYLIPEFKFERQGIIEKKIISSRIRKIIPNDSYIYTNDDVMELFLYDKTVFPNQVFYNGMSTFKYSDLDTFSKQVVVVTNLNTFDYVSERLLKINSNNTECIGVFGNYKLYLKK